jgi:hypothetical protein
MKTVLINGQSYAWSDIKMELLGRLVQGVTAISYESKQEKVNNYGAGTEPVSRGRGKKEYESSITLEMKEVEAIQRALGPGRSLEDILPFDINIGFITDGNVPVKHTLRQVEFTNNKRDVSTGDTTIEVELELIVGGIDWM